MPDVITNEELERQLKVVQNERRQSYENRPYGQSELVIPDAMYTPDHPYHWPTIGSHADLEAAGVADVRAFFERYYLPSNASLVVAGDFDFADLTLDAIDAEGSGIANAIGEILSLKDLAPATKLQ